MRVFYFLDLYVVEAVKILKRGWKFCKEKKKGKEKRTQRTTSLLSDFYGYKSLKSGPAQCLLGP
jgi:hypothetical protein